MLALNKAALHRRMRSRRQIARMITLALVAGEDGVQELRG